MLHTTTTHATPAKSSHTIFFQSIQAYKAIVSHTAHITNTLPRSGINKNINKNKAFITTNDIINWLSLSIDFFFLISHAAIKITYHNLKNSDG